MFAYCLNNPVNRVDGSGLYSLWKFLFKDHDFGFIHRAVQAHIALNHGAETEICILGGRADIKIEEAVWEVKHAGTSPWIRICQAQTQAKKYIDGKRITHLGTAGKFNGFFYISCGDYSYYVEYTTPAEGVVLYTVTEVQNYNGKYFRNYQPHAQQNEHEQLSPIFDNTPMINTNGNSYIPSGGGGGGGLFLAATLFAGTIFMARFMTACK